MGALAVCNSIEGCLLLPTEPTTWLELDGIGGAPVITDGETVEDQPPSGSGRDAQTTPLPLGAGICIETGRGVI